MNTSKYDTAETKEKITTTLLCSNDKCRYLDDFKEILRDLTKDANVTNKMGGGGGGTDAASTAANDGCLAKNDSVTAYNCGEIRSMILTRNNNDSYPLNKEELKAELLMSIWQQLTAKQCPEHFLVGIARVAEGEIEKELENAKVQENLQSSKNNNQQAADTSAELKCLDLLKLQKFIGQHVEKLLLRLSDNSKEDVLKNYAECQRKCVENEEEITILKPIHAVVAVKNKHRKMEDRHMCLPHFSDVFQQQQERYCFYGVFDGHSGSLAATYASNQIPFLISKQLRAVVKSTNPEEETDYYREVLETSFLAADLNFTKKSLGSGTTAVCALLKSNPKNMDHLYVAWVGDSRCLLVSPTVSLQLVKPHKPDSIDERKRIEDTGGAVILAHGQWRVNGIINVSRSIGDFSVKAVIAEPDFVDVPLQPSHDFLVMGTDGLWDHVSETDIVKCVYKALIDIEQPFEDIPKHLVELAKQGDSQDNITVVVILLKQRSNIIDNYKKCMAKSN